MKKVVSLLLVITMFFTFACACNKEEDNVTLEEEQTVDVNEGRLLKEYMEINKTGKYMIKSEMDLKDDKNTIIPVTITISGASKKMITLTFPFEDKKLPISLIINGDKKILLFSSLRTYGEIGKEQLSQLTELVQKSYIQLGSLSFVEDGTVDVKGTTYSYEDYSNPTSQQVTRYLFKDGKLVMIGNVSEDGVGKDYQKFNISGNVTNDMFVIPEEYENSPEQVRKFATNIDKLMAKQKQNDKK